MDVITLKFTPKRSNKSKRHYNGELWINSDHLPFFKIPSLGYIISFSYALEVLNLD